MAEIPSNAQLGLPNPEQILEWANAFMDVYGVGLTNPHDIATQQAFNTYSNLIELSTEKKIDDASLAEPMSLFLNNAHFEKSMGSAIKHSGTQYPTVPNTQSYIFGYPSHRFDESESYAFLKKEPSSELGVLSENLSYSVNTENISFAEEEITPNSILLEQKQDILSPYLYAEHKQNPIQTNYHSPEFQQKSKAEFNQVFVKGDYNTKSESYDIQQYNGPINPYQIKKDFPILQQKVNGRELVWLDNAATTQKPQVVIDRLSQYYAKENSNVHRAAHTLAAIATDAYDDSRRTIAKFINASPNEIVFVRGATEGLNLLAHTWGIQNLKQEDEILISHLEHHANIVPWQIIAQKTGAKIKVIPVDETGQISFESFVRQLSPKTKLLSITQVSNALGTITPLKQMIATAKSFGITTIVDGSQGISHMPVDVKALGTDFYVFSGHKLYAPTGIGVVYGDFLQLERLPPWQSGGNMIVDVTFERTVFQNSPAKFEAGTGNIADAIGLGAAIEYLQHLGMEQIGHYEHLLLSYALIKIQEIPRIKLIGTPKNRASVISFVIDGLQNDQIGQYLNEHGIAVRTGHHCAQPILRRFGVEGTIRPSIAFYNTCEDIDHLVTTLWRLVEGAPKKI